MILAPVAVEKNIKNAAEGNIIKGDLYEQKGGNLNECYRYRCCNAYKYSRE